MADEVQNAQTLEALMKAVNDLTKQIAKNQKAIDASLGKNVKAYQQMESLSTSEVQNLERQRDSLNEIEKITSVQNRRADYRVQRLDIELKLHKQVLAQAEAELNARKKTGDLTTEAYQELENALESQRQITNELENAKIELEGARDAAGDMADSILNLAGIGGELGLGDELAYALGEAGSVAEVFQSIGRELSDNAGRAKIMAGVNKKLGESIAAIAFSSITQALALDTVEANLRMATGATREYSDSIRETFDAQRAYGVTAETAALSINALYTQTSDFTRMNSAMRDELVTTGALLQQMGVSSENFAGALQVSIKALGMTAGESRDAATDLARFAAELGVAPETMMENFRDAGPHIAKFSQGAQKSFKELAKTAKATGIEMGRLFDYTAQFDTFEGAAERVGSLNAMLGGDYINAMDLMMTEDPSERINMITDAIHASGRSFEEMGYHEKIAIANAAGFSDVQEMAEALSGSNRDLTDSTEERALSEREMQEIAQRNMSAQEKMAAIMSALAPRIIEVLDAFQPLLDAVMDFVSVHGPKIFPILLAWRGAMFFLQVQHAMNARELTTLHLAKLRDEAQTKKNTIATEVETGAETLNTAGKKLSLRARLANIVPSARQLLISKAQAIAHWAETAGIGGKTIATAAGTIATWAATASTWALAAAMVAATGGLILIIPAVIGIVKGFQYLIERFGLAKTLGVALGLALLAVFAPVLLIPIAIGAALWTIVEYWDQIVAGISAGASFLVEVITGPFIIAWELIKDLWNYFFGASMSPFMEDIVNGVVAAGQAIIDFLTWPYRMAWDIVTGIWSSTKDFFIENWDAIKQFGIDAMTVLGRITLAVLTGGFSEVFLFIRSNWDAIVGFFSSGAETIKGVFMSLKGVIMIVVDFLKAPFNGIIGAINWFLEKIEQALTLNIRVPKWLPGPSKFTVGPPNLGRIPKLAQGTDDFQGGLAMVGEEGPELVNMPGGSSVDPADKTSNFVETLKTVANVTSKIAQVMGIPGAAIAGAAVGAIDRPAATSDQPVSVNITLELDKRVLAEHTEEVMISRLNPASA